MFLVRSLILAFMFSIAAAQAQTPFAFPFDTTLSSSALNAAGASKADATNPAITGTLSTSGTASLGTGLANHIELSGAALNPLIQVAGSGTNGTLLVRGQGTGGINLGSATSGNILQLLAGSANGDTLQILQPAALGTAFSFRSPQNNMATVGGVDFFNLPVSVSQNLTYSGDVTKRNNTPVLVGQTFSGASSNIGAAYPLNWTLQTINMQSGEPQIGNYFQTRSGTGAILRSFSAVSAATAQQVQPVKSTDAAVTWQANHLYATPGTIIVANGYMWQLVTAGTSSAVGSGPACSGVLLSTNVTDGTAVWNCEANQWLFQTQVAFNATATAHFNLGGTAATPIGTVWGAVIGSGSADATATFYNASTVLELDDFFRGSAASLQGMNVAKLGTSGTNTDWGVMINGNNGASLGYWNPVIIAQGIKVGGTAFAVDDQIQGFMQHGAGGVDFNFFTPDGLGPSGGGYFARWGGAGISGNIDQSGSVFLGYGGVRPTATGLTIDTKRLKFTGASGIVSAGSGWSTGAVAKDQNGNIVTVTTDGGGHVTALASTVVAGYRDAAPSNPVTFYPATTGTTVGPFLKPNPDDTINTPITIVPFTATTTYAASATPNLTIGASTDRIGFYAATPIVKATPAGACAGNTGCQALRDALGNLGLINTGSISN